MQIHYNLEGLNLFYQRRLVKHLLTASATNSSLYEYPKNLGCILNLVAIFKIIVPNASDIIPFPFF